MSKFTLRYTVFGVEQSVDVDSRDLPSDKLEAFFFDIMMDDMMDKAFPIPVNQNRFLTWAESQRRDVSETAERLQDVLLY